MKEGDIYETKLKDGRFGAIWILKTGNDFDFSDLKFNLIATTTYIDSKPPDITDSRLSNVLIKKRICPSNNRVIYIYCGEMPKSLRNVGNIAVPRKLRRLKMEIGDGTRRSFFSSEKGFPSRGDIPEDIGSEVLIEWRFKNDKEAFLAEVAELRLKQQRLMKKLRNGKPKKMLSDDLFWSLVSQLDWTKTDDNEITQSLIKELSQKKVTEIKQFEESLAYKLYQIDTKAHASNIGESSYDPDTDDVSVDFFLYARCAAVANGKEYYDTVLKNPKEMPKNLDFEPILSVSESAYELKMKKEFEYETGVSYETYSNEDGWK